MQIKREGIKPRWKCRNKYIGYFRKSLSKSLSAAKYIYNNWLSTTRYYDKAEQIIHISIVVNDNPVLTHE